MDWLEDFPYREEGDVMYVQNTRADNYKIHQKSEVQLYRRFPYLQFKSDQLKKKYIYLGRETEKTHPFYVRFSLSEESEEGIHQLISNINERMKVVVGNIVNPSSSEKEFRKALDEIQYMIAKNLTPFPSNSFSVHHGYLLTGIAKPNIRFNDVFDSLFLREARGKGAGRVGERKGVLNMMKLGWDYKYHSYEYFAFMSRAYLLIRAKISQEKLPEYQIDDLTSMELFNFGEAKTISYCDEDGNPKQMRDTDYYDYFSNIFKHYAETILQLKPASQQRPRKYILAIDKWQHQLYEFDFPAYFQQRFKGKDVSSESIQRMANHNYERYARIMHGFPIRSRQQRVEQLKKIVNQDRKMYHRIRLLAITSAQSKNHVIPSDEDFIILFVRDDESNVAKACSLKEVIDKMVSKKEEVVGKITDHMENLKIQRESLYYSLYRYEQWGDKYDLLAHFSFNPSKLSYEEDGVVRPAFDSAMMGLLGLDQLPLTLEQQLLTCTPSSEIDIYEQLQKLVKEYQLAKQKAALSSFCSGLSDEKQEGIRFYCTEDEEDELGWDRLGVKVKLLQLSMIDFESNRMRCLYPQGGKGEPFNAFTPPHYKELHQYLTILLIQTSVITNIQYTKSGARVSLDQLTHDRQLSPQNFTRVKALKENYEYNWRHYNKYKGYNQKRKYFRQVDQSAFRAAILSIFQDLQHAPTLQKGLREMMRVMLKSFIAVEFLETRMVVRQLADERKQEENQLASEQHKVLISEYLDSLEVFRKTVQGISKEEKKEGRGDLLDPKWKVNQAYYRELKASTSVIGKEFVSCKEILKMGPLKSEHSQKAMAKESLASVSQKMEAIKESSLVVFCGVYRDMLKLQDQDYENTILLYKVLLCFSCHLPYFHKNELLRYQLNSILTLEAITPKIYKFKAVVLVELVSFVFAHKAKYLP